MRPAPDMAQAAEEDRSSCAFTNVRAGEVQAYLRARLSREGLTSFAQVRLRDRIRRA